MLAPDDFARFADVCSTISNEVADEQGFVAVRDLLRRFQTDLLIRPLLVEGMLASVDNNACTDSNTNRWAVLVDSETYPVTDLEIEQESRDKPLHVRLRNTIAHELVHALAFRPSEFGIRLRDQFGTPVGSPGLVKAIERETERLSPLLLWSDKALRKLLRGKRQSLSVDELSDARRSVAISRHVLISRLRELAPADLNGFRSHQGLRNLAIGIGEWVQGGGAIARSWPLFINFDRAIMPSFLIRLYSEDRLPAATLFPDSDTFAMCGGPLKTVELVVSAGLRSNPHVERMRIQCSVERTSRKVGATFLFVARKSFDALETGASLERPSGCLV